MQGKLEEGGEKWESVIPILTSSSQTTSGRSGVKYRPRILQTFETHVKEKQQSSLPSSPIVDDITCTSSNINPSLRTQSLLYPTFSNKVISVTDSSNIELDETAYMNSLKFNSHFDSTCLTKTSRFKPRNRKYFLLHHQIKKLLRKLALVTIHVMIDLMPKFTLMENSFMGC